MGGGTNPQLDEPVSEDFDSVGKETRKLPGPASLHLWLDYLQKGIIRIGSKEMRLEGIKSREESNHFLKRYLPVYNRRFDKKARREANVHRKAPQNLKQVLSIQSRHFIRNDNTIRHANRFYQILRRWPGRRPKDVVVQERLDGKLYITDAGRELKYHAIQEPPRRIEVNKEARLKNP